MLNRAEIIGNLGGDPEIRRTQSGAPVASFTVATSEKWRDKATGERKERTQWHRVVIWNEALCKIAEQYLKKGSKVYIAGQMETREWEKDGVKRYVTEIVLRFKGEIEMLGDARGGGVPPPDDGDATRGNATSSARKPAMAGVGGKRDDMDDEIPF